MAEEKTMRKIPAKESPEPISELTDFRRIMENLFEGVYCVDSDRKIVFWNRGAERITGYSREEVLGSSCSDNILGHVDSGGRKLCAARCPLTQAVEMGLHHSEADIYLHHKDGHRISVSVSVSSIKDAEGRIIGAVEIFRETSEVSIESRYIEELKSAALIDSLTGLPNRRYIEMKLGAAMEEKKRFDTSFAVLFADIDHFKDINDGFGHDAGDMVLKMASRTMGGVMRAYNLLGRWGGEEFIGVVSHIDEDGLRVFAGKLGALVESSFFDYEGSRIGVTVTIGGTMARKGDTVEKILKRADSYLYLGKKSGRNVTVIEGKIAGRGRKPAR